MALLGVMVITGVGSAVALSIDDDDWYDENDDYCYENYSDYDEREDCYYKWSPHNIAAICLGALCIVSGTIATPLLSCAGGSYMAQRNATGKRWAVITAWILYAIADINGWGALIAGAAEVNPGPVFVLWVVIIMAAAWIFMYVRAHALRTYSIVDQTVGVKRSGGLDTAPAPGVRPQSQPYKTTYTY